MYHTSFGRYVVSIGNNAESARLVGINISKIKIIVYSLSGLLAATSGALLTSRLTAAMPEAGLNYEMDAVAATVIGGTSLSGGKASLLGTAFGSILMALVRNGLNLLNINTFWHQIVLGSIVLIAVVMDVLSTRFSDSSR
jgi:ribose transport system permease protein